MEQTPNNRVRIKRSRPTFTTQQKAGLFVVIGSGCLAMILGIVFLFHHLSQPFQIEYEGPRFVSSSEQELQELIDQQTSDTDGDGLTDFDELYVYRTSPYLADTDGDGVDDPTELEDETNPTCAPGANCTDEYSASTDVDPSTVFESLSAESDELTAEEALAQIEEVLQSFSADEIRMMLLEAGATQAQVDEFSDEDLEVLFSSVLSELQRGGELQSIIEGTLGSLE